MTGDELSEQLPVVALKLFSELPVAGGIFKALEILAGIDEGVLQKRWQKDIEQRVSDLESDIRHFFSERKNLSDVLRAVSDENLNLFRQIVLLIQNSHSREKRKIAARIMCYSVLSECDVSFDLASQFSRDLDGLELHHILMLKLIYSQSMEEVAMKKIPLSLEGEFSPALYQKTMSDLNKLGFISGADGTWDGSTPTRTEYLKIFVKYLLQDIQS